MRKQGVFAVITAAVMSVGAFFMTGVSAKAADSATALSEIQAEESAETGEKTEGDWDYVIGDDGMAYISGYNGEMTEVEIPTIIDGHMVIGTAYWEMGLSGGIFGENDLIESIIIPEGVKYIGSYSFSQCKSLKTIVIPDSIIEIGYGAFSGCSSLESVEIPEGVMKISYNTFSGCSALKNIELPEGILELGLWAFSSCTALRSINIPSSVTGMDAAIFENCTSLESVEILEGVTKIGHSMFDGCVALKNIKIPTSVEHIGEYAFGYTHDSEGKSIKLPDFTIYGYPGTAAEDYAKENGFTFIEIKDEPVEEPTQTPSNTEITVGASGELSPKLETAKEELFSSISKYFTEDELSAVRAGASALEIKLSVASLDDSVSESDKELIAKAVNDILDGTKLNFKVMNYLDIKLQASIDGRELSIAETDGLLTVSVELENPVNGACKVIRIHDGKAEAIDAQLSKDGKRISFATDKFSTYAIAYSDVASGDSTRASIVIIAICIAGLSGLAAGTVSALKKRGAA